MPRTDDASSLTPGDFPFGDRKTRGSLSPVERFERALWEAETAIQDAKELIFDLLPFDENIGKAAVTAGMLAGMLQIAKSTIASVRNMHGDMTRTP